MKKQLSMLAILVSASLHAQAAQEPFFTITEVASTQDAQYATGISGNGEDLIGVVNKNKQAEYFSTVHFADFLVDRFRFEDYCMLSDDVCETLWDGEPGFAYQWRRDFLDGVEQRSNVGYVQLGEKDGLVTGLGDTPADRVGYTMEGKLRTAFAIVNESGPVTLNDAYSTHSLSIPTSIQRLEDGQYLVTGTAASGKNHVVGGDPYNWCFDGDDDEDGDYRYCPGVDTQASFWLINSDGSFNKLMQAGDYARPDNDVIQTASAAAVAKVKVNVEEILYGVGYSSTGEAGDGEEDGRNIASYWALDLTAGSVGSTNIIPLKDGEAGVDVDNSERMRHSWAVDINKNGYVVGNQRWATPENNNMPVEMFVFNLKSPETPASVPLQDLPLKGSGSEAAALNDHDMVVGWRDSRHQTQPVDEGTNRMQEAFLLDATNSKNNNWYLNDLICREDAAGTKLCAAENGKYYHIAYARDISRDGTIAATAYRYDSESDLNNRIKATVVAVKLNPIVKDYQGNAPAGYVVSNAPVANQTSQDSGGGGGSLFWLTLLALPFAWLRRHQR